MTKYYYSLNVYDDVGKVYGIVITDSELSYEAKDVCLCMMDVLNGIS